MKRIEVGHNGPANAVYVVVDERGESEDYEAFSLHCYNTRTGKLEWTEGIRKNRTDMISVYREAIDAALRQLKGDL